MKLAHILKTVFFLALILLTWLLSTSRAALPLMETRLRLLLQGLGGVIALSAAFQLLLRAGERDPWHRMAPLIVPLAAGLLLVQPHWMTGLVLVVTVAGVFARDWNRGGGSGGSRRFRRSPGAKREPN